MVTITRSLQVERSVEDTYNYLADFSSTEQWDINVITAAKLTAGLPSVGTRFSLVAKSGGSKVPVDYEIAELEPNRFIRLKGEAKNFSLVDSINLSAIDDSSTKIDYHIEVDFHAGIGRVAELFPSTLDPMTDSAFDGLIRALNDHQEPISHSSQLSDKLVLPSMLNFTKRGYLKAQKRWKGLAVNLTGKNAVITGATSGLGKETAFALGKMGANILVVARNPEKAQKLAEEVTLETGRTTHTVIANLESIAETHRAAEQIKAIFPKIDILVNNAGALFNERQVTEERLERSLALLLVSPFTLTQDLLPELKAAEQARIINVSSGGMYTQPVFLNDLNYEQGKYDGPQAYARAKRGLVDMTELWSRVYKDTNMTFNAMHPGWADTPAVAESLPSFYRITKPFLRTPKEGADTIIWLAAAKEAQDQNGLFWLDRQPHTTAIFPKTQSSQEKQQKLYARLCELEQSLRG